MKLHDVKLQDTDCFVRSISTMEKLERQTASIVRVINIALVACFIPGSTLAAIAAFRRCPSQKNVACTRTRPMQVGLFQAAANCDN